ncbi:hypothetical protein J2S02_004600 [Metabacillus niabensis]|uniref:Uncharacterized protein n=1 Tax=Metabacillus niabensis TaxID=324854 RepID=A0ABT9Z7I1_9BACI|nr:hypothetical protein [Metabacillus niabensis]
MIYYFKMKSVNQFWILQSLIKYDTIMFYWADKYVWEYKKILLVQQTRSQLKFK